MTDFLVLLIIIFLIVIFETVAIACTKQYHLGGNIGFIIGALFCYAIVCFLLSESFNYTTMGITNILWSGLSVLAVAATGIILFKEEFHLHDMIAAILITSGIVVFEYNN